MLNDHHLEHQIGSAMQSADVPGLALAIIEGNALLDAKGFGIARSVSRAPVTPDTVFQAASLSKPLFAYAVLTHWAREGLSLDTLLRALWVDPSIVDPRAGPITARHVLTHTAGFPNWRDGDSLTVEVAPGTRFSYSGEGYEYLQRVVEHLTKQPLHAYMQAHVLEPLGMRNSTFAWRVSEASDVLLGDDGHVLPPGERVVSSAAYSLLTTAPDYAAFHLAMMNPVADDPLRLGPTGRAAMLAPQVQVGRHAALRWGLGWGLQRIGGHAAFWHWGGPQNGFTSYTVASMARRRGVVILTNGENGLSICEAIAQRALDQPAEHPAFAWLLPSEAWSPTGQ